jgi:hypothetical protein
MSLLTRITDAIRPLESAVSKTEQDDEIKGSGLPDSVSTKFFGRVGEAIRNLDRAGFLEEVLDMSSDFAIADKALQKLCGDATANPVRIDAPVRRKKIIQNFLDLIGYENHRKSWMYLLLRDGDEFLQREFSKSLKPGRVAFTRKVFRTQYR